MGFQFKSLTSYLLSVASHVLVVQTHTHIFIRRRVVYFLPVAFLNVSHVLYALSALPKATCTNTFCISVCVVALHWNRLSPELEHSSTISSGTGLVWKVLQYKKKSHFVSKYLILFPPVSKITAGINRTISPKNSTCMWVCACVCSSSMHIHESTHTHTHMKLPELVLHCSSV